MADTMGVVQNANFIPEVWANVAIGLLESELHLAKNVARDYEFTPAKEGDTIHIPVRGTVTANAKVSGSAVTLQNPTATKVDVVLNNHWEVTFAVEDIAKAQANQDVMAGYVQDAIIRLAEKVEVELAKLYSQFTTSDINSASTNLDEDDVLLARKTLTTNRAPMTGRFIYLDPAQVNVFLKLERFTSAEKVGTPEQLRNGMLGKIHGFEVYESIFVQADGSPVATHNIAMHKNAMVLATRPLPLPQADGVKGAVIEKNGIAIRVLYSYNADQLADQVTIDVLFGVKALRPELGIEMIS